MNNPADGMDYEEMMRGHIHNYVMQTAVKSSTDYKNDPISQIVQSFLFNDDGLMDKKLQMKLNQALNEDMFHNHQQSQDDCNHDKTDDFAFDPANLTMSDHSENKINAKKEASLLKNRKF